MAEYTLEEKDGFTVIGMGTELKSNYTDYDGFIDIVPVAQLFQLKNTSPHSNVMDLKSLETTDLMWSQYGTPCVLQASKR